MKLGQCLLLTIPASSPSLSTADTQESMFDPKTYAIISQRHADVSWGLFVYWSCQVWPIVRSRSRPRL